MFERRSQGLREWTSLNEALKPWESIRDVARHNGDNGDKGRGQRHKETLESEREASCKDCV